MEKYNIEINEKEMWIVVKALHDYSEQEETSHENSNIAMSVFDRIKTIVMKRSEENFIKSR